MRTALPEPGLLKKLAIDNRQLARIQQQREHCLLLIVYWQIGNDSEA